MRGQRVRFNENGDEVDENFWAQAAADQAAGRTGDQEGDESMYLPCVSITLLTFVTAANGGAIPFNTQFFHDDYDDGPGFDDVFEGEGDGGGAMADVDAGEQDLLAATAGQTRRVRPEFVNYAKRAKRVDVRKLKENIWRGLDIKIAEVKEPQGENEDEPMVCTHYCFFQLAWTQS
jgi:condensin complex subunit 2